MQRSTSVTWSLEASVFVLRCSCREITSSILSVSTNSVTETAPDQTGSSTSPDDTTIQPHEHPNTQPYQLESTENGHVQDYNQFVKDQVTSQKHTRPKHAPREIKLTVPAEVWLRHAALSFSSSFLTLQRPSLTPPGSRHLPLPVERRQQSLKTLTDSPASQINQTPPTPPQIRHPLFHLTRADSIKQQIEHGPETAREEEGCKAAGLSAPPTAAQFRLLVPMLWGMGPGQGINLRGCNMNTQKLFVDLTFSAQIKHSC